MKKPMYVSMRGGEKIYINGAVLQVDRKVTLALINDVTFLLEGQVMQVNDATTPLRQLYFVVQLMLMNPGDVEQARSVFETQCSAICAVADNAELRLGLDAVKELVETRRYYDALRKIRALFEVEQAILNNADTLLPVVA